MNGATAPTPFLLPQYTYADVGTYTADVSDYVIGWVVGSEWYEFTVYETNAHHAGVAV